MKIEGITITLFFFFEGAAGLRPLLSFFFFPQVFCLMLACVRACKYLFFSFFLSFLAAKAPARVYYNVQILIAFLFFFFSSDAQQLIEEDV